MIQSAVTERFQTTIPKGVREALGLRRGDTLAYEVRGEEVSRLNRLHVEYAERLKAKPGWATAERRPDMNHFMARLIFCFFAEDTGIFHARPETTPQGGRNGSSAPRFRSFARPMEHPRSRGSFARCRRALKVVDGPAALEERLKVSGHSLSCIIATVTRDHPGLEDSSPRCPKPTITRGLKMARR